MKLFCCTALAGKIENGLFMSSATSFIFLSDSCDEALGKGITLCREHFPAYEGWGTHGTNTVEINIETIGSMLNVL